ncbi:hypothetical protein SAMD00020551_2772 [Mesobacillus selenatarsenatis SF-1]|uniref:Uncharacterized protein n=1 Tax=Mesobacillus selenatarsenatis (strain DSM 18680 / JCM 14380 / FERM P-15431 / SF-1) TaxID=1321606 RepID=A0A0A8X5R8_MESS1|nr:hypothetical protein SAMD00020551_2772 [Mesobacillus selenatarsenatis SF-1]
MLMEFVSYVLVTKGMKSFYMVINFLRTFACYGDDKGNPNT